MNKRAHKTAVILDNIRSAYNVGSVFRSADGAGVEKVYLCGRTSDPIDRFGRVQSEIHKTALGAEQEVAWEHAETSEKIIGALKEEGWSVVAVEQTEKAIDFRTFQQTKDTAFVFGNEIDGVSEKICKLSDFVISLPMLGAKESLNVSVSVGVVLYHTLNQSQ